MNSWHYNEFTEASAIQEIIDMLNEDNFAYICTEDNDFFVTHEDNVVVGVGALMIAQKGDDGQQLVYLINTNKITYIEIRPVKKD